MPNPAITHIDARRWAQKRLPRLVFDYIDGAAGQESAALGNTGDLALVKLAPRVLADLQAPDLGATFLGKPYSLPFGIAPMGMCNLAWPGADQVLAWNGVGFSVYYVRSGEVPQWRNTATGAASQDGAILPPGVGLFLRRQAGALAFAVPGEVRTTAFVRPPFSGSQIIAGGFPVDASPADLKLAASAGLTAGTAPSNADQLLAWDATAFSVYYLRAGQVPQWRNVATGLLDYSTTAILPARGASLLLLRAPVAGAALPQMTPFSL